MAPLTITASREAAIDFTRAYYDIGLRVLYKAEDGDEFTKRFFLFIKPFETSLWLLILASVIAVSIGVAIIGRLNPYDWYQSPPDDFSLWEAQFQMTLYNSIWQVLSAVFQQGIYENVQSSNLCSNLFASSQVQKQLQDRSLQEF